MKKTGMLAAFAALTAAGTVAVAAQPRPDWVVIGSHSDGGPVEIDRRSVATPDGITRVWWRHTFAQVRSDGAAEEAQLEAIDCEQGHSTGLAILDYDASGAVLFDSGEPEQAALDRLGPVTPGTTGELVAEATCRMRPRPTRR